MSTQILHVILQPKYSGDIKVKQRIVYKNNSLDLTDEERSSLEADLPEFWHTDKDRLTRYQKYDDMYFCERYKDYFDYATRETKKKYYKFDVATDEQAQQLYVFFLNQYSKIKINRIENLYKEVQSRIGDISYVQYSLLETRDALLKESDYTQMPDYPMSDGDREIWKKYRQDLRDLTSQQAWISGDIINVVMPVSPAPESQLKLLRESLGNVTSIPSDLMDDEIQNYLNGNYNELISKVSQTTIKFEILKALGQMKLPVFDFNYSALADSRNYFDESLYAVQEELEDESLLPSDWWQTVTRDVDALISNINDRLSSFNINFTINDVITSILEENMKRVEAERLIETVAAEEEV